MRQPEQRERKAGLGPDGSRDGERAGHVDGEQQVADFLDVEREIPSVSTIAQSFLVHLVMEIPHCSRPLILFINVSFINVPSTTEKPYCV